MILVSEIVAPASAPQGLPAWQSNPFAGQIVSALREQGGQPVAVWRLLDRLARTRHPRDREHLRFWRLMYWRHLRDLLRIGLVFRWGRKAVVLTKPLISVGRRRPRASAMTRDQATVQRAPCVVESTIEKPGSTNGPPWPPKQEEPAQKAQPELGGSRLAFTDLSEKPKALALPAAPTRDEISRAASKLAKRSSGRRVLSGWLHGERMWRMRHVLVPSGRVLPAYLVRRNKVMVVLPDEPEFQHRIFERYEAGEVKILRSPEARLLGALKSGIKERRSERKAAACRANGLCPVRPGSRPRGRPPGSGHVTGVSVP